MAPHTDSHPGSYVKHNPGRTGDWEAAGLRWLNDHAQASCVSGEAGGGAAVSSSVAASLPVAASPGVHAAPGLRVARVMERAGERLVLERISTTAPTALAAENFGRALAQLHARTHDVDGQPLRFGSGPAEWVGDGYQGPNDCLLPLPLNPTDSWGAYYADLLESLCTNAAGRDSFSVAHRTAIDSLLFRLRSSDFDATSQPAPIHGDLWSGNVLWARAQDFCDGEVPASGSFSGGEVGARDCVAVLIDPAAHVGHPETDLAALQLFGAPHLERILGAYAEAAGLDRDWRDRTPLHQLHLLFLHVAVFGGSYEAQAMSAVRAALRL